MDTPEETGDFELYLAHAGLQATLGDPVPDRRLGGSLRTVTTKLATEKLAVVYLDFAAFKGKTDWKATDKLGTTTFALADVVDIALHPEIATPLPVPEYTPPEVTLPTLPPPDSADPVDPVEPGHGGRPRDP